MSAKFRVNRKYRVSSGNYSAGGRPRTASSNASFEESYHSDFEALDNNNIPEEKSNLFFLGESIGDQLNLTSEFNIGGSLLEEDEDIPTTNTATAVGDKAPSSMNYGRDDIIEDEEVKQLLREEEYEEDYYLADEDHLAYEEDDFEIASPTSNQNPSPTTTATKKNDSSPSPTKKQKKQTLLDNEDNQTLLPDSYNASTADNTLAEFSSITFANSGVLSDNKKKKKLITVNDSTSSSKKKGNKFVKKRGGTPGLPTIKSPKNNEQKGKKIFPPRSASSKERDQVSIGKPSALPPRPKSHPVKFSSSKNESNSKNSHSKINSAHRNIGEVHWQTPGNNNNNGEDSLDRVKLPKVRTVDSEDAYNASRDEDDDFKEDLSTLRSKKSKASHVKYEKIPITTELATIGKPSLSTFSYYNAGSVISTRAHSETTLPVTELQKLYKQSLKQIKELKEKNSLLQDQLDSSNIQNMIQNFQYQIVQKEEMIQKLSSEILSYRTIIRNQEKGLLQHSQVKESEFDILEHQEKDIEVLYEQLKKIKQKMFIYKERELEKELLNEDLKIQMTKIRSKNIKLKKQNEQLTNQNQQFMKRLEAVVVQQNEEGKEESQYPPSLESAASLAADSMSAMSQKDIITEKRYQSLTKVLQHDISHLKQQIQEKDTKYEQLNKELQKRETFIEYQTSLLTTLKLSFRELSENHEQLLQGSILIGRDVRKPPAIKLKKPETPKLKDKSPPQKKGMLIADEEEGVQDDNNHKSVHEQRIEDHSTSFLLNLSSLNEAKINNPYGSMMNDDNEILEGNEKAFFITESEEEGEEIEDLM